MSDEIFTGLVVSRFVHYAALSVVFGGALFPFYGVGRAQGEAYRRVPWLRALLLTAAWLTLASACAWLGFAVAAATGEPPRITGADILLIMIGDMESGSVWLFRLLLAAILIPLLFPRTGSIGQFRLVLSTALILLASIALTGNAGSNETSTGFQHRLADAVHLVASGAWIGALAVFSGLTGMAGRHRPDDLVTLHEALSRFAGVGSIVVAGLTLSGMFNPGFFMSSLDTAYGQVLLAKLALFVTMLVLAVANRFWLTPKLATILAGSRHTAEDLKRAIWGLQASIMAETLLALLVLATVAVLGAVAPPDFR